MDPKVQSGAQRLRDELALIRPVGFAGDIHVEVVNDAIIVSEIRIIEVHGIDDVALRAKIQLEDDGTWTLYDRFNDDWDVHFDTEPHTSFEDILFELTEDPSDFFWG